MSRLNIIRFAIKRAPVKLHDFLFELACRVLLPISTICKVCNILRGMILGFVIGVVSSAIAMAWILTAPGAH